MSSLQSSGFTRQGWTPSALYISFYDHFTLAEREAGGGSGGGGLLFIKFVCEGGKGRWREGRRCYYTEFFMQLFSSSLAVR